jgi:hypothetical protein
LGLEHDPRLGDDNLVERLGQYVIKMAHVRRIRAAIARDNDVAIVSASVPDPRNAIGSPPRFAHAGAQPVRARDDQASGLNFRPAQELVVPRFPTRHCATPRRAPPGS